MLLDAGSQALSQKGQPKRQLLVVLDNLEKFADRTQVETAVIRRADELRSVRCHLVFFFDPADQYAPNKMAAGDAFNIVELTMLPVRMRRDGDGHVSDDAAKAIRDLLNARLDVAAVFQEPDDAIKFIAIQSGGRLRDVLAITREACDLAGAGLVTPVGFGTRCAETCRRLGRSSQARPLGSARGDSPGQVGGQHAGRWLCADAWAGAGVQW